MFEIEEWRGINNENIVVPMCSPLFNTLFM